jgi:hypothetical protein
MALSEELSRIIEAASEALAANADGELILPRRKRIWTALGPRLVEGARATRGVGLTRRTTLAGLCVRRVLELWTQAWPQNERPVQMLSIAEQYLNESLDFTQAWNSKNMFWGELEKMLYEGEHLIELNVGFAAANVVTTALNDERFDPQQIEADVMDDDLDPYEWDASLYASAAAAGGFTWETGSDATRRREFWQWYLNEAVPGAWEAAA